MPQLGEPAQIQDTQILQETLQNVNIVWSVGQALRLAAVLDQLLTNRNRITTFRSYGEETERKHNHKNKDDIAVLGTSDNVTLVLICKVSKFSI